MEEATKILINVRVESADKDLETTKELLKLLSNFLHGVVD